MKQIAILLVAVVVLAGAALLALRLAEKGAPAADDAHRRFARALAYYLNENAQDYRRARQELLPLEAQYRDSVAWRVDMALIDLSELNHPVQGEADLAPDPPPYQRLLENAAEHLQRAHALAPNSETIAFNLARTYQKLAPHAENDDELRQAALDLLQPLVQREDPDASALFLYGTLKEDADDYQAAYDAFARVVAKGKDFVPQTLFRVSELRSARALIRIDRDRGIRLQEELDKKYPDRPKAQPGALERGPYTEFLELAEAPDTVPDPRAMNWHRVTRRSGIPLSGTPPYFLAPDLDGGSECARDLVMNGEKGVRLLRNRGNGTFKDLTADAGIPADFPLRAAAVGDVDGDERADLVIGGPGGVRILLNATDPETPTSWKFVDATGAIGEATRFDEPVSCLVLFDLDHDGDLDLFVGGAKNRVYRTAIDRPAEGGRVVVMREVAAQIGMEAPAADDALMLDVDGDDDVDLLVAGAAGNAWFDNRRELRFDRKDLPAGTGLAAGDIDNDLHEEILVGGTAYRWDGSAWQAAGSRTALLDLDGDGVFDPNPFDGLELPGTLQRAVGTDLNRDGAADLVLATDQGIDVYVSAPDRPAAWLDVAPRGLATNETGIGTRLHLFAGDLRAGATCRDGVVSFGLGRRTRVDAVVAYWTNGVAQGVTPGRIDECLRIDEREGEVGSCPFVYAFDGARWHFVADVNSGTPLGLPYADGKYLPARSNETILVPGRMLRPVDGELRLDVTEEFRELFYVDQVVLRAIDHPADARPVLNEGFRVMHFPEFGVHSLGDLRPPLRAHDQRGRDVLDLVRAHDGRHAVVFETLDAQYEGLARPWSIELDFGDLSRAERVLLVMDGWVEFPTASASIACSQTSTVAFRPPVIEVIGADGAWQMADPDAGFPAGKGKSVLVDLTGKFPTSDCRLRVSSTQRLHWDAFLVSTEPDRPQRLTELGLKSAHHRFHGVGKRIEEPGQPWRYSHDDLEPFLRWNQMPAGMLTRYGDVTELLLEIDDRYPILASGDLVELRFDASALPELPEGWVRDYCFTTEGWVKDADLNQAIRESCLPLPFHAMSKYPYTEPERYPHDDFVATWLTRPAAQLVDPAALIEPKPGAPAAGSKGSEDTR